MLFLFVASKLASAWKYQKLSKLIFAISLTLNLALSLPAAKIGFGLEMLK